MDCQNLWSSEAISSEVVLVFPMNFLDFGSDTIAKQGIMNLGNNGSKSHISVVFSDSEIVFLGDREDAAFSPFLFCVLFVHSVA